MIYHLRAASNWYTETSGWKTYPDGKEYEWARTVCGEKVYSGGPDHNPEQTTVESAPTCPACIAEMQRERLDRAVELLEEALPILRRLDAYLDRVERSR